MQPSTTPDLGDHIQESQELSPFPAGDSKAARNRQDSMTQTKTNSKHKITKKDPQKKHNMNKSLSHKVANEFIIKKGNQIKSWCPYDGLRFAVKKQNNVEKYKKFDALAINCQVCGMCYVGYIKT